MFFVAFARASLESELLGIPCVRMMMMGFALQMNSRNCRRVLRTGVFPVSLINGGVSGHRWGLAFLGERNRVFAGKQDFLSGLRTPGTWTWAGESLAGWLEELCAEFQTE